MTGPRQAELELEPALTLPRAAALWTRLVPQLASAEGVVLDLGAVTEMDSAGVQILLMAVATAGRRGIPLTLRNPSPVVRDTLALLGLDHVLAPREAAP